MEHNCFVTLLGSDNYLIPVLMLYESYLTTNSSVDFKILVTDNVSKKTIDFLQEHKIPYIVRKNFVYEISNQWTDDVVYASKLSKLELEQHYKAQQERTKRYVTCMNKLWCFGLTDYEKIFFLDGDMIFLKNCDELFNFTSMSFALTVDNNPESLIATIFGCKTRENFDLLLFEKAKKDKFNWTDETFFRQIFSKVKDIKVIDLQTYCPTLNINKNYRKSKLLHYLLTATFYLTPEQTVKTLEDVLEYWNIPELNHFYNLVIKKYFDLKK